MAATLARMLTVSEIAEREGVHPSTVRRRLHRLNAREHVQGRIVKRLDDANPRSKIFTTLSALCLADPDLVERQALDADRQSELEKTVAELSKRVNALRSRLREHITGEQLALFDEQSRAG